MANTFWVLCPGIMRTHRKLFLGSTKASLGTDLIRITDTVMSMLLIIQREKRHVYKLHALAQWKGGYQKPFLLLSFLALY